MWCGIVKYSGDKKRMAPSVARPALLNGQCGKTADMWLKLSVRPPHRNLRQGKAMFGFPIQTKRFDKGDAFAMTSSNNPVVPSAREALNKFKMEAASDLHVPAPS